MNVAFITGGSSGIGRACVEKFLSADTAVGFIDANKVLGEELVSAYTDASLYFYHGDVCLVSDVEAAIIGTYNRFGKINVVFANAGIYEENNVHNITESSWDRVIDTNLKAVVFTINKAIRYLDGQHGGAIVINASDQCFVAKTNSLAYGASKAGLGQITKSIAVDLAKQNVRVNAICPGAIKTNLNIESKRRMAEEQYSGDISRVWAEEETKYPLGRIGSAVEVAELVFFLASERSSFITGSLVTIDGGYTAI
ncbi:MAG: SDR family oxidoreductase [Planctomycetota bacterium]|nr:SDR family oxidoreductase [bacterium]